MRAKILNARKDFKCAQRFQMRAKISNARKNLQVRAKISNARKDFKCTQRFQIRAYSGFLKHFTDMKYVPMGQERSKEFIPVNLQNHYYILGYRIWSGNTRSNESNTSIQKYGIITGIID